MRPWCTVGHGCDRVHGRHGWTGHGESATVVLGSGCTVPEVTDATVAHGQVTDATVVHGQVTDATSLPLPGVTVAVKGSDAFAVTDERGAFDLDRARRRAAARSRSRVYVARGRGASRRTRWSIHAAHRRAQRGRHRARAELAPPVDVALRAQPDRRRPHAGRAGGSDARPGESLPGVVTIDEGAGLFVRGGDVSEVHVLLDGVVVSHPYRYETPTGGFRGAVDPFLTQGASFTHRCVLRRCTATA